MKSTFKWGTIAFGVSLISTLVYGQARTPFTRPGFITTAGNITTSANVSASTLSVGTTSTSTRAHFLTEATVYTPTDFTTSHAVFGRNAVSGASSGGVWLTYHTTDNEGVVGSLSPTVAWRPLSFAASAWKFRPNGGAAIADITSTGAFNSSAISGNQAFTCTNTGCRLSLGATARYMYDTGGAIAIAGAAFQVFNGAAQADTFADANGGTVTLRGSPTDGATAVGVALRTNSTLSTSGAKLVSFRNNTAEQASVDKDGLLRVNAANAAKPTCNATNRGKVYFLDGGAGVADTYEVCGKSAADTYSWKTIVTF